MGAAFTPGLKVTERSVIRKQRRLPLKGTVVVEKGARVGSEQVVARTDLPGKVYPINVAGRLNCLPTDVPGLMKVGENGKIEKNALLAESAGIFGLFKTPLPSPVTGTVESISRTTGTAMLREAPTPVEVRAYVDGRAIEVFENEGVTVETIGVFAQGIFGLGGEVEGPVKIVAGPTEILSASKFTDAHSGSIAVGGKLLTLDAYKRAQELGVRAVVVGGMHYNDIKQIVGHEIGVAITGTEKLATTIVVTEGFGEIAMAKATHALLARHEGKKASANGATQIRAGVIRPEVIIPLDADTVVDEDPPPPQGITIGSAIRIIRAPHFGKLGKVVELPIQLARMESETLVRMLVAELENGEKVSVPRANVEMIERE